MPSGGVFDVPMIDPERWRIDPPIGDEPVTGLERLRDALDARLPGWDDLIILGALAAFLVALGAVFVEMAR